MKHLLNVRTGTVHKHQPESDSGAAVCGALRHVPQQNITLITTGEIGQENETRCGRCFDGVGGY